MSSCQSSGSGSRDTRLSRLPAMDLMGVSELFSSWPSTRTSRCQACNSSSRNGRVRSEMTTSCMRQPVLAKHAAAHSPAPRRRSEKSFAGCAPARLPGTPPGRSSSALRPISRSAGLASSRSPARFTSRSNCWLVECEDRDVDLLHHLAQQRGGFERAQPLLAQRAAHGVDLLHHLAQRVVDSGAARPHRKIAFAQRGQQVRQRVQRKHHALAHRAGEAQPAAHDQHRQGPLDFWILDLRSIAG